MPLPAEVCTCLQPVCVLAPPDPPLALLPRRAEIVTNSSLLYSAISIIGATVMPHNLFLHSSIIQTRAYARTPDGKRHAIKYGRIDCTISLAIAFFINAAILILAAAAFFYGPDKVSTRV